MHNQRLATYISGAFLALAAFSLPVLGQSGPADAPSPGFYGGIALRQAGTEASGVTIGPESSVWGKFTPPVSDDTGSRSLFFGGYRFAHDLSVEAAFGLSDRYSLRPDTATGRSGVGLSLSPAEAPAGRGFNADVYTSWSFLRQFALYGRMGYAQADALPGVYSFGTIDARRTRDGMNYGLGLRYDINRALGLRVEYARFNRFAGEAVQGGVMPESDQVQLGVQLRF